MSLSKDTSEINTLEEGMEVQIPDLTAGPEETDEVLVPPVFNEEIKPEDETAEIPDLTAGPEEIDELLVPPVFNAESEFETEDLSAGPDGSDELLIPPVFNTEQEAVDAIAEVEESADASEENIENEEPLMPPEPEESKPFYGSSGHLTWWGFSQQGESHKNKEVPCQDRCKVVLSESEKPVVIAAIADGVGSCALSHYGASIVTDTSVSYLKEVFDQHQGALEDKWVGDHLRKAMTLAQEAVAKAAEEMQQLEYSFQSTLTIAVYDAKTLYVSHIGDDGVVALPDNGTVELITMRHKGEEASSVYPLQAGPSFWQVMKVDRCVSGFVMATDGVLDAFVRPERENNRVYYPFIQPAFETRQGTEDLLIETMEFYHDYMESEAYRANVTDDITMVVVTNQLLLVENGVPEFDGEAWAAETAEYQKKAYEALYPDKKKEAASIEIEPEEEASVEEADAQEEETAEELDSAVQEEEAAAESDSVVQEEEAAVESDSAVQEEEAVEETSASEATGVFDAESDTEEKTDSEEATESAVAEEADSEEAAELVAEEKADSNAEEADESESGNKLMIPLLLVFGGAIALAAYLNTLS